MSGTVQNISIKTKLLNLGRLFFKISFFETSLRKIISKNSSFSGLAEKLVPPNYLYNVGSYRRCTVKGIELDLDISDYVGHYLYFGFEDKAYDKLFSLVKKGNTILDIGANIGFTALKMANDVGTEGNVYAFEPDVLNFSRLTHHLSLNKKQKVTAYNVGLADKPGELKLSVCRGDNRGMNRIDQNAEKDFTLVKVITVDDFLREQQLQKVDLIKMDVEGFEFNVLKGCERTIRSLRPILFIELDDANLKGQGASAKELLNLLEREKYKCVEVMEEKILSAKSNVENCHLDIVCYPI